MGAAVKLGLLLDLSSVYADVGGKGSQTAAEMAAEDFGGKVLGRPIEVIAADHQNKAEIASTVARQWFDQDGVTAIMDVQGSATALAAMQVAEQKDRIIILNGPGSSSITGTACIPTAVHYSYNTYALAHSTGAAITKGGGTSWFFIAADYSFGEELMRDTANVVKADGGTVAGSVKVPLGTADFSSYLLQAQASGAKVLGFANAGTDVVNAVKQAAEFGIPQGGQTMAALLAYINDIQGMGLQTTQGMLLTSAFYWDRDDASRAFAKKYFARMQREPNMSQAGIYSSVTHYLQAVQTTGTTDAATVMKAMKAAPIDDFFTQNGHIRDDGMMVHDMYLFQVKTPAASKSEWDMYTLKATIPGDEAYLPLAQSRCPLVKK